jgi:hypothetical protein
MSFPQNVSSRGGANRRLISFLFVWVALGLALSATQLSAEEIQLKKNGSETYSLPVRINDAITLDFLLDTGASDVSLPADVVLTLLRTGTVATSDFIGKKTYVLADGSQLPSLQFMVRRLRIGQQVVNNVVASAAPVAGSPLLGQSFLSRLPPWAIDYRRHILVVNAPVKARPLQSAPAVAALPPASATPLPRPRTQSPTQMLQQSPFGSYGRWSSTAYPGAGGEVQLTDIALIPDGTMVGRIFFSGSRCAAWANFSGRVDGEAVVLSMYVGQCGLTVATLRHVATGWAGTYRSQYPDAGVVQIAQ